MTYTAWRPALAAQLKSLPPDGRVAFVGLGHPLRGDDRVGLDVVDSLRALVRAQPNLLPLAAGSEPAAALGPLRRFKPHLVCFIDAAYLGRPAGTIAWLEPETSDGISASTHAYPLALLSRFLTESIDCKVRLLGIQPASIAIDSVLSPAVAAACQQLTTSLASLLHETLPHPIAD